jgi:hypothetical protein
MIFFTGQIIKRIMSSTSGESPVLDFPRRALFVDFGLCQLSKTTDTLMNKLQSEHDVEVSLKQFDKEHHDQTVLELRQLDKYISDSNWRYTPIEKLIGL